MPQTEDYKKTLREITNIKEPHARMYMAIIGYTGVRKGEAITLKWSDIDFDKDIISIRRSANVTNASKNNPAIIKEPKTKSGIRDIPMVPQLKEILLTGMHMYEYVVTDLETGQPIHTEAKFNTMWRSIKKQMDVGKFTSHSYRHALCTMLLASGVDVKTVQSILGHSQPSTTLNIYAHALPDKLQEDGRIFTEKIAT